MDNLGGSSYPFWEPALTMGATWWESQCRGAFKGIGLRLVVGFRIPLCSPINHAHSSLIRQSEQGVSSCPRTGHSGWWFERLSVLDCHVLTGHGWRKRHAHFSAGFQSGSLPLRPQWEYHAFVLLIVFFHKCRSTPHWREPIYRVFPIHSFSSPYQFATAIAFKTAEDGDTFSFRHFSVRWGMFRIPVLSLMARSSRFITPSSMRTSMKNSYQLRSCASR